MPSIVEAHLGLTQTLPAVAAAWQLAVRQEQTVWPNACRSDTCPDTLFLKKAA